MYGLETAQLNDTHLSRLDVFQLKGFRKIANMDTTWVQRNNDNKKVYKKINEIAHRGKNRNTGKKYSHWKNFTKKAWRKII